MLVTPEYEGLEASVLEVLDSTDRIPMVTKRGDWYYNFWRDERNPRGLWRRTGWESYLTEQPDWQILLDVDALSAAEGVQWVFAGASLLRPAVRTAIRTARRWSRCPRTAGTLSRSASSTSRSAALCRAGSSCPRPRPG